MPKSISVDMAKIRHRGILTTGLSEFVTNLLTPGSQIGRKADATEQADARRSGLWPAKAGRADPHSFATAGLERQIVLDQKPDRRIITFSRAQARS